MGPSRGMWTFEIYQLMDRIDSVLVTGRQTPQHNIDRFDLAARLGVGCGRARQQHGQ